MLSSLIDVNKWCQMLSLFPTQDNAQSSGSNLHDLLKHHVEKLMDITILEIPKIDSLSN